MIGPDDFPPGWKVEHVLRLTAPDGSRIRVAKDDGSPVQDWEELAPILERVLGTARRAEAARRRRREIRRRRRDDERRAG
jgi:hypothetical protein